jgi:hypothetical protein
MKIKFLSLILLFAISSILIFVMQQHDTAQTTELDQTAKKAEAIEEASANENTVNRQKNDPITSTDKAQESLFSTSLKLLEQARNNNSDSQFELSKIIRLCDIILKNKSFYEDDANYYLATSNEADSSFFSEFKQALTDCAEFNEQNMQDFHTEQPDVYAADYWLGRAAIQQHQEALQQAMFYAPQALQQNKAALAILDQQLANSQSEALLHLGACLSMQGEKTQAGLLLQLACQKGGNCSARNIEPLRLIYLFHCSTLQRTEEITADGHIFNEQLACYQKSSLQDMSDLMLADQDKQSTATQLRHLQQKLSSTTERQALLQRCLNR